MSLYDSLPEWQEYRARLDQRRRIHAGLVQAASEAHQQHREVVAEYRAQVEAAVLAGNPIPTDEPASPGDSYRHAVIASQQMLNVMASEGRRVRGGLAPEVEHLRRHATGGCVSTNMRAAAATIDAAATEVTRMLQDLASARAAADEAAGATVRPSRSARTRSSVTAGDLETRPLGSFAPARARIHAAPGPLGHSGPRSGALPSPQFPRATGARKCAASATCRHQRARTAGPSGTSKACPASVDWRAGRSAAATTPLQPSGGTIVRVFRR